MNRILLALLATVAVAAACSGERPQLLPPNTADSTTTLPPTTQAEVAALQQADCQTATGSGPVQVVIDGLPTPAVPCTLIASHQRAEFVNNTAEPVTVTLTGATAVTLAPTETFVSEPVGTVLQPGLNQIDVQPFPSSALWYVEPGQSALTGQLIGLSSIGEIELGQTAETVSASIGNLPLTATDGECVVSSIAQDPYSPLFTFRNGSVAVIQVFTPGQLTRSEIGIGALEGDVVAAYGERIEAQPSPDGDETKSLLVFVPSDEADQVHRLVFALENGVVTSIRNGLTELALTTPGC